MEIIASFFANILSAILPSLFKKEKSEFSKKYDQFCYDAATALSMYARCTHNPINLAEQPDRKLPKAYEEAYEELRKLGARANALAAIFPENDKSITVTKENLREAAGGFFGLSNNLCTPYGRSEPSDYKEWWNFIMECERDIKTNLNIKD